MVANHEEVWIGFRDRIQNKRCRELEAEVDYIVELDQDECIGCQSCNEICPEVFGFDDEIEKAFVYREYSHSDECIEEAATACPVDCIEIEEDEE